MFWEGIQLGAASVIDPCEKEAWSPGSNPQGQIISVLLAAALCK